MKGSRSDSRATTPGETPPGSPGGRWLLPALIALAIVAILPIGAFAEPGSAPSLTLAQTQVAQTKTAAAKTAIVKTAVAKTAIAKTAIAKTAIAKSPTKASTPTPKPTATTKPAPPTATKTRTRTATPTKTRTPTRTPTPTVTPTPTITPTPTPLPPTPTQAKADPQPTGYFVGVYLGRVDAPGLDGGLIRGRVLDFSDVGVGNVQVALSGEGKATTATTAPDGSFAFAALKPGVYGLSLPGFPSAPADGLPLLPSSIVNVDFVESARPGTSPSLTPSAETPTAVVPSGTAGVVVTVLTPEGGSMPERATETPTPRPTVARPTADVLGADARGWLQAFVMGLALTGGISLVGVLIWSVKR